MAQCKILGLSGISKMNLIGSKMLQVGLGLVFVKSFKSQNGHNSKIIQQKWSLW